MAIMAENVLVVGKENGEMLLDSINNGPFQFKEIIVPTTETTIEEKHMHKLKDLSPEEKIRKSCDITATNIILLCLPVDIYTLVINHGTAKYIWNMVNDLIEGTELTIQERESKLYDDFDRYTSKKGKSFHSYYLRYAKLINDMNII
ncbi:hypothetical protein Tco_1148590, partial [Tanacetum coccineum]